MLTAPIVALATAYPTAVLATGAVLAVVAVVTLAAYLMGDL